MAIVEDFVRKLRRKEAKWWFHSMLGEESAYRVPNPECGWYQIFPFTVPEKPDPAYLSTCLDPSQTLCMIELCLEKYPDRRLDGEALSAIREILDYFASQDLEIIVRPTYDLHGEALQREPQKIGIICDHLTQLGEILQEYQNSIFMVQGLLIGNWGEMHGSRYVTKQSVRQLYEALRGAVGENMWIALRRPRFVRWIMLDPSDSERICLFNDAILSSETDMGTYSSSKWPGAGTWFDMWTRDKEIDFQRAFCLNRPNGGEVAMAGMPFSEDREQAPVILRTLMDMHVGYLNSQYDTRVFEQWKKMPVPGNSGRSLFEEIARRVGYRFVIKSVSIKGEETTDQLQIRVANTGFSNFLEKGVVTLTIDSGPGKAAQNRAKVLLEGKGEGLSSGWMEAPNGTGIMASVDTDVRAWYAGKETVLIIQMPKDPSPGRYRVFLSLRRESDHKPVLFANQNTAADGSVLLGEIGING